MLLSHFLRPSDQKNPPQQLGCLNAEPQYTVKHIARKFPFGGLECSAFVLFYNTFYGQQTCDGPENQNLERWPKQVTVFELFASRDIVYLVHTEEEYGRSDYFSKICC